MSQNAYDRFEEQTDRGTVFVLDGDAVDSRPEQAYYEIPALRRAEEMGDRSSANMIMLGALIGTSGLLGEDSVRRAIAKASPSKAGERNARAFTEGIGMGRARLAAKAREGSG
jgi:2-oxoglutarate ferredoxin oxidoreductase subunit gamma